MDSRKKSITIIAIIGVVLISLIIILGTIWIGQSASQDSKEVARTVSLLYLDELAGRREQVVADNLKGRITDMQTALGLIESDDLKSVESLQRYQPEP